MQGAFRKGDLGVDTKKEWQKSERNSKRSVMETAAGTLGYLSNTSPSISLDKHMGLPGPEIGS